MTQIDTNEWICKQFANVNCGDLRLDKRAVSMALDIAKFDGPRMTMHFDTFAKLIGAYRFLSNKKTNFEKLASSHWIETMYSTKGNKKILALQDTTELNYSKLLTVKNMSYGNNKNSKVLLLHSVMALDGETRRPLGLLHAQYIDRDRKDYGKTNKHKSRKQKPEEKESYRWYESILSVKKRYAETLPEEDLPEIVMVGDRESDIFEVLSYCQQTEGINCIVRCCHNRAIDSENANIYTACESFPIAGITEIDIENPRSHKIKKVKVNLSYGCVDLKVPSDRRYNGLNKGLEKFKINVIYIKEIDPADNEDGLCWRLFTTCPVNSFEDALDKMFDYKSRWRIEDYHKCLKTGLKAEKGMFDDASDFKTLLGILTVLAYLLMFITYEHRTNPNVPAEKVLGKERVEALNSILKTKLKSYKNKLPKKKTLRWAVYILGLLGGYVMQKRPPGLICLWRGIRKFEDIFVGYKIGLGTYV